MHAINRRSVLGLAGLTVCGLSLSACNTSNEQPAGSNGGDGKRTYRIGILQLTQHAALDETRKGFLEALDDSGLAYTADEQNANNDQSACVTIAAKLVGDGDDLIFAIATPAAQAAASATQEIPIVASAITDFAAADLVHDNTKPGTNVTGTSDLTPVADQIKLLQQLIPTAKTVGILYCSAESNSDVQVQLAEDALAEAGITAQRQSVSSSNEIQQAVEALAGKVDAIYAPTDNTIAAGMATVAMVANGLKLPVIVGCDTMVEDGGLASISISYRDLGKRAGEMAARILADGDDPANMPIEYLSSDDCKLVVNTTTAQAVGVDVSVLDDREVTKVS